MPQDDVEWQYFTYIFTDFLLVYYNKFYREVYLDNGSNKIADKQMTDYRDGNVFETGK